MQFFGVSPATARMFGGLLNVFYTLRFLIVKVFERIRALKDQAKKRAEFRRNKIVIPVTSKAAGESSSLNSVTVCKSHILNSLGVRVREILAIQYSFMFSQGRK